MLISRRGEAKFVWTVSMLACQGTDITDACEQHVAKNDNFFLASEMDIIGNVYGFELLGNLYCKVPQMKM